MARASKSYNCSSNSESPSSSRYSVKFRNLLPYIIGRRGSDVTAQEHSKGYDILEEGKKARENIHIYYAVSRN